jgi:transcriptional repressor NrdR
MEHRGTSVLPYRRIYKKYDADSPHPSKSFPIPKCSKISTNDMKCPYCGYAQDRVVDSRESKEADSIRRRRECERCNKRFTTYERIDEIPYMVVKKDGRREKFDRSKILSGLLRACEKRPISAGILENLVDDTETFLMDSPERERTTNEIGQLLMEKLKELDTVSYIRFASVYRDFKDVNEFKAELEQLLTGKEPRSRKKSSH